MTNNTNMEVCPQIAFLLAYEETVICQDKYVGSIEIDRFKGHTLELIFDGYNRETRKLYRLTGTLDLQTLKFKWE